MAQYEEILKSQGGGCAICGKTPEQEGKNLAVDHLHLKEGGGKIRGILCSYDNHRRVGRHNDPDLLRRIADYLANDTGYRVPLKQKKKKRRKKRR